MNHAIHMAAVTQIRHRGTRARLLRPQDRRRHGGQVGTPGAQATHQRRARRTASADARSAAAAIEEGPGRAIGERLYIQRGRLTPPNADSPEQPLPGPVKP